MTAHEVDPVEERAALADVASLRARVAALEACLRDMLEAIDRNKRAAYLQTHEVVMRARALLGEGGGR